LINKITREDLVKLLFNKTTLNIDNVEEIIDILIEQKLIQLKKQ
jgi:hypothetical protein